MTNPQNVIHDLYNDLDVPEPSSAWPVAPLKPLLARLPVRALEMPGLTCKLAQDYLLSCGALDAQFLVGDAAQESEPLAGFAYQGGECAFLFVNSDDLVVRRRFSMAHELGHYLLHFRPALQHWREALEAGEDVVAPLFDAYSQQDIENAEDDQGRSDYDRREREADTFAAALLLPVRLVADRAAALAEDYRNDQIGLQERLAIEFLVSRAAMRRRLVALAREGRPQ